MRRLLIALTLTLVACGPPQPPENYIVVEKSKEYVPGPTIIIGGGKHGGGTGIPTGGYRYYFYSRIGKCEVDEKTWALTSIPTPFTCIWEHFS